MKNSRFLRRFQSSVLLLVLAGLLWVIGVGYAKWTHRLHIKTALSSGAFEISFDQKRPYCVKIIDQNGMLIREAADENEIGCVLDEEGKAAQLSIGSTLLWDELAEPGRVLVLQFPLRLADDSTVQSVALYQADLTQTAEETLVFAPVSGTLIVGGNEYPLPQTLGGWDTPLYWDVYRQIERKDGEIVASIFLRLQPESASSLHGQLSVDASQLPQSLQRYINPLEDGTRGVLAVEIEVTYSCSAPLYAEQGHP